MLVPQMYQQPVIYIDSLSQLPPGVMPLSQGMLQQALGYVTTPPQSTASTVLKSALKFGALGAGAGALLGILPGPPGVISAGLLGGIAGVALGAFFGFKKARQQQDEYKVLTQQKQAAWQAQAQAISGSLGMQSESQKTQEQPVQASVHKATKKPAKFPKAKTWTDTNGNIRQVGTGKIIKRGKH